MIIACSSFLSIDIIATAPCDNSFVNKSRIGIKGLPMNRHKWPNMIKNPTSIRWRKNGVVTAWSSFLSADIIATAPCDNIVVN